MSDARLPEKVGLAIPAAPFDENGKRKPPLSDSGRMSVEPFRSRGALRRQEVRARYGASYYMIDREVAAGRIRAKRVGKCVFLDPKDCETVFGFEETLEPSRESMAELADLLR